MAQDFLPVGAAVLENLKQTLTFNIHCRNTPHFMTSLNEYDVLIH